MSGKFVDIAAKDGGRFKGYLAMPAAGQGPGLMVLQEIFGVNESIRATSDYFAGEGYVVLAPDMFWRMEPGVDLDYTEEGFAQAIAYNKKFDLAKGVEDMQATVDHLHGMKEVTGKAGKPQVAALGYCLGGALAYQAAAHCGVDAAVAYYGVGIEKHLELKDKVGCPMVFHFGSADTNAPEEVVDQIKAAFEGRDDVLINVYEGAPHAFANRFRDNYDEAAAAMAHSRTMELLRAVTGPS